MGGYDSKNQSPDQYQQGPIDYAIDYEKLIKLGLTIKEISGLKNNLRATSVEISTDSLGVSSAIQECTLTVRCANVFTIYTLKFSDGILIEGKKKRYQNRKWTETRMEIIDTNLIGLTVDEACQKYPGSFRVIKRYKLGCDGWILTNVQITDQHLNAKIHLNEEYKIIKITCF